MNVRENVVAAHSAGNRRRSVQSPGEGAGGWLPVPLTSFIGRAGAIAELSRLLTPLDLADQPAARLVTLVGPGDCGKTRLALAVAEAVAPQFADGARLVALDALSEADLVPQTVATTLDLREAGSRPLLVSWPDGALIAGQAFTGADPPADRTVSGACRTDPSGYGCKDPVYGTAPSNAFGTWLMQQLGGAHSSSR